MSNAFARYCDLLDRLGSLRYAGDPVEAESDVLDEMDEVWEQMAPAERTAARKESYRAPTRAMIAVLSRVSESIDFDKTDVGALSSHGARVYPKAA